MIADEIVSAATSGGTQTTTNETLSSDASARPAPKSLASESTAGEESSKDTSTPRLVSANPMLVPSKPDPMI